EAELSALAVASEAEPPVDVALASELSEESAEATEEPSAKAVDSLAFDAPAPARELSDAPAVAVEPPEASATLVEPASAIASAKE
ncbi:MAG: hypothetical protein KDA71_24245, partial [Planctomycetales bacterium]|nr:hypothetical protein [Planctomycetales bacterium]